MSILIRPAAVAGMFYAAQATELRDSVNNYLDQATADPQLKVKAIIAPHAGYIYSGSIAASAYIHIQQQRKTINRVILLGPNHREPLDGIATSSATHFETPLGTIPLDQLFIKELETLPFVRCVDSVHSHEHSLEVHLPFLQVLLKNFTLVPIIVGDCVASEVAHLLQLTWGGNETLIVVSSDLSHFHDYQTAQLMDHKTSLAIEQFQFEKIGYDSACGRNPVNGLLNLAQDKALHVTTLDVRNSGDTAGDKGRVVGYGAYSIY